MACCNPIELPSMVLDFISFASARQARINAGWIRNRSSSRSNLLTMKLIFRKARKWPVLLTLRSNKYKTMIKIKKARTEKWARQLCHSSWKKKTSQRLAILTSCEWSKIYVCVLKIFSHHIFCSVWKTEDVGTGNLRWWVSGNWIVFTSSCRG